jgi:hypothetical protein
LVLGQKIGKEEAKRTMLTREQFLEVHEYHLCFDITYVMKRPEFPRTETRLSAPP